jgi:hypothetical protein
MVTAVDPQDKQKWMFDCYEGYYNGLPTHCSGLPVAFTIALEQAGAMHEDHNRETMF